MSNDSTKKTIVVALGVCLVCSILVATAAVSLSGRQQANKKLDKINTIKMLKIFIKKKLKRKLSIWSPASSFPKINIMRR